MTDELPKWTPRLPSFPHKVVDVPVTIVAEYYKEHLRRGIDDGNLNPPDYWVLLRGLLIAASQTYASIKLLLSKKRPKPLMLQASILNRSLFEILTTVIALTEKPDERARMLHLETIRMYGVELKRNRERHGEDPGWKDYLDVFETSQAMILKEHDLPAEALHKPESINADWPTPGVMLWGKKSKGITPFISGSRHAVVKELYDNHYAIQSAQTHARVAAVSMAMLVDRPDTQWNPGHGESGIIVEALIFLACIISEIQAAGGYNPHPKLNELWAYLRELDLEAQDVWKLRYSELLSAS